jgi:hypothetical protein
VHLGGDVLDDGVRLVRDLGDRLVPRDLRCELVVRARARRRA